MRPRRRNSESNEGIQANNVTAEVLAVGRNARAEKHSGGLAEEDPSAAVSNRLNEPREIPPAPGRIPPHASAARADGSTAPAATDSNLPTTAPRVFISYAWEDDEYRQSVKKLAARLRADGVNARMDVWHLEPGQTIPEFMNHEVRQADKILILCSPAYRAKVHAMEDGQRTTGVGYESMILSSQIWVDLRLRKRIIPALLRGAWPESAPDFLIAIPYVNLSGEQYFEREYRRLITELTDQREPAPPVNADGTRLKV